MKTVQIYALEILEARSTQPVSLGYSQGVGQAAPFPRLPEKTGPRPFQRLEAAVSLRSRWGRSRLRARCHAAVPFDDLLATLSEGPL